MSNIRTFKVAYDAGSDVLYITRSNEQATRGFEDDRGVVWRYANGELIGATVMDFYEIWAGDENALAHELSEKFKIPEPQAHRVVDEAMSLHDTE